MKIAHLGSISHGTLLAKDLIHTFAATLNTLFDSLDTEHKHAKLVNEAQCPFEAAFYDSEAADQLLEELTDALNEYAPPYCRFGAHEGDGSDFGFWFYPESFERAVSDGEVYKVNDLSEICAGHYGQVADSEYIAVVNDHGNVTLYSFHLELKTEEVLSVV